MLFNSPAVLQAERESVNNAILADRASAKVNGSPVCHVQ
jgi:hypothetical protein